MSYDIFFVKGQGMNSDQVEDFLESDIEPEHPRYIDLEDRNQITHELSSLGLDFDVNRFEDSISLDFPSFQLGIFDNQVTMNIPYWETNTNPLIQKSIQEIFHTLLRQGYQAFDPQIHDLVEAKYDIGANFNRNLDAVKDALDSLKSNRKWWKFW